MSTHRPDRQSFAPCSLPSRTPTAPLRGRFAILDCGCAWRTAMIAVGTEKQLLVEQRN